MNQLGFGAALANFEANYKRCWLVVASALTLHAILIKFPIVADQTRKALF
jgi:hypothetical protein